MISAFEIGAVFKIVNQASPTLTAILRQIRALNEQIDKARANLASIAGTAASGVVAATTETGLLAKAWGEVATNARLAQGAMRSASRAALPSAATAAVPSLARNPAAPPFPFYIGQKTAVPAATAIPAAATAALPLPPLATPPAALPPVPPIAPPLATPPATAAGVRNAGRNRLGGFLGGGGGGGGGAAHYTAPSVGGGLGHFRFGGIAGGLAAGVAYAGVQAAKFEDAAVFMAQHAGVDYIENRAKFENILKDATMVTGYNEHEVSEATQDVLRQFKYTGGDNGISVLPNILRYGATEARLKGTGLKESESSMVGMAHMLRQYSSEEVEKLAPAFSILSVANPMTLPQMKRAFGYAVPLLQAGMDLDPVDVMAASTGLARAGIDSSKAGTWIREMMKGAMPGTSMMSKFRFNKHEAALRELGLVDENHNPTWFKNGKPDELSFLEKVSENLPKIDIKRRIALLEAISNTRGAGALAVLADPSSRDQVKRIREQVNNPEEIARIRNFQTIYGEQSTKQNSRQALQTFNVMMADLGDKLLPSVNAALNNFKSILEGIRSVLPAGTLNAKVGGGMLAGAAGGLAVGAGIGAFGGPVGAVGGAIVGAGVGGVIGAADAYMAAEKEKHQSSDEKKSNEDFIKALKDAGVTGRAPAPEVKVQPFSVSLILDSHVLAQAMTSAMASPFGFSSQAPAADGMGQYFGGDHQSTDK